MARWAYDKNGNKTFYSKFDIRGATTIKLIFPRGKDYSDILKLKVKGDTVWKKCRPREKTILVRKIFMEAFKLMLERVARGDIYELNNSYGTHVLLQPYKQKEVEALRSHGAYSDVDMIKTGWRLPMFIFRLRNNTSNNMYDRRISPTRKIAKIATTELEKGNINFDTLIA